MSKCPVNPVREVFNMAYRDARVSGRPKGFVCPVPELRPGLFKAVVAAAYNARDAYKADPTMTGEEVQWGRFAPGRSVHCAPPSLRALWIREWRRISKRRRFAPGELP